MAVAARPKTRVIIVCVEVDPIGDVEAGAIENDVVA